MLHGVEHGKLTQGRTLAIGVDDLRHVVLTQQSSEERSGGLGIAILLEEDVQHSSVFVDRPPQPVFDAAHVYAP